MSFKFGQQCVTSVKGDQLEIAIVHAPRAQSNQGVWLQFVPDAVLPDKNPLA